MKPFALQGILFIAFWFSCFAAIAQGNCANYDRLIQEGDQKFHQRDYKGAINKYQAALNDCDDLAKAKVAQGKINHLIDRMKELSVELRNLRRETEILLGTAQEYNLRIDSLQKAVELKTNDLRAAMQRQKEMEALLIDSERKQWQLLDSFPITGRDITLAQAQVNGKRQYFYVNAAGMRMTALGTWDHARQFRGNGYALVRRKWKQFFIDESGHDYRMGGNNSLPKHKVESVDWTGDDRTEFEYKFQNMRNLQLLISSGTSIRRIPSRINALERLKFLDISYNKLMRFKPNFVSDSIQRLDLEGNRLRAIAPEIADLHQLSRINLNQNRIDMIPRELFDLQHLLELKLEYNLIADIPEDIQKLKGLEMLDLGFNQLQMLPDGLRNLQQLKWLGLSGNQFKITKDENILTLIRELKALRILRIGMNPLSDTAEEREQIRKDFSVWLPDCLVLFN